MYDENSMKKHIFWIKVRRVFLLILFTIIGTTLGVVISDYVVNILLFPGILRVIIVVISAVLFLSIALISTANTGKEIEDSYWKIAVYKKLAIISKKLDNLESSETSKNSSKTEHKISHENMKKLSKESSNEQVPDDETQNETEASTNDVLEELKHLDDTLNEVTTNSEK